MRSPCLAFVYDLFVVILAVMVGFLLSQTLTEIAVVEAREDDGYESDETYLQRTLQNSFTPHD